MRFGFCAPIEHANTIASLGYDYIEPPLVPTLKPEEDSSATLNAAAVLADAKIDAQAFNIFLPGNLKITGPDVDPTRQATYLKSAIGRVSEIGGKVIVFGSAGARSVPDGFSHETALGQIESFLELAAPIAKANNVTIVIEPLNRGECNIVNGVTEGMELVRDVNHPNIQVLSDLFHVDLEKQSYDETRDAGSHLAHVHVAGAVGRRVPNLDDIDFLAGYFKTLKEIGYARRISIEGQTDDIPAAAKIGIDVLNQAWAKA